MRMLAAWLAYLKSYLKRRWFTFRIATTHLWLRIQSLYVGTDLLGARRYDLLKFRLRRWIHMRQRQRRCLQAFRQIQQRHHPSRGRPHRSTAPIQQMAVAMTSLVVLSVQEEARLARLTRFDTDSDMIGIDNRASACISHIKSDFKPGTLKPCSRKIQGFGGQIFRNVMVGTLVWRVEDDSGRTHVFSIPGSYYVPEGGLRLFSPQHFAQTRAHPGAHQITHGSTMALVWMDRTSRYLCLGRRR